MKYQAQSSIIINADLKEIFDKVKDFSTWKTWSPWSIVEPSHKQEITGTAGQMNHSMSWDGELIGSGTNTLVEINEKELVYDLAFFSPFRSEAKTSFLFEETGEGVKVTWTMDGNLPFFMFFMKAAMKSWIEMDYDRGLTMLKAILEEGKVDADSTSQGVHEYEGFSYVGIKKTLEMKQMQKEMGEDFRMLKEMLAKNGKTAKHWISLYPKTNMATKEFTYIAACSAEDLDGIDLGDEFIKGEIKPSNVLEIKHRGSYRFLGNAWSMGMMTVRGKKMKKAGAPFEYYWNSPEDTEDNKLETSIFFPVK